MKYSTKAGIINITTLRPDRQAFLAKADSIGMKFARTPIDEPPKMAQPRMRPPIRFEDADVASLVCGPSSGREI